MALREKSGAGGGAVEVSIFVTKTSVPPFHVVSNAPEVVGNWLDPVKPVTYPAPAESTASPKPPSQPLLPRYVEYASEDPLGDTFVRNASTLPFSVLSAAFAVVGKSVEAR